MGIASEVETIKAAQKPHKCSWCGTTIEAGESYKRYRWFGDEGVGVVKEHPECYEAMQELIDEAGGEILFSPGDSPRGCNCGFDAHCPRCNAKKEQTHNAEVSGAGTASAGLPGYASGDKNE